MSVNALLVQWVGGWHWVAAVPSGRRRRERQFDLSSSSLEEVERVSRAQLDIFADVRYQVTAQVDPKTDGDRAFLAYELGDTVTVEGPDGSANAERVVSITTKWDVNSPGGHPEVTPQFNDVIMTQQAAFATVVERMNRGALGGHSPAAGIPIAPPPVGGTADEPFHVWWTVPNLTEGSF